MKRMLMGLLVVGTLTVAIGLSRSRNPEAQPGGDLQIQSEERNPWTHLRLNNDPSEFRFVIVSDRTGGHRARVFSQAVDQINLLQPEFVLSVGDLIEGYTEKPEQVAKEWREFQGYVNKLQMPFFYVPGNHDLANDFMEKAWKEKFGRRYYSFVYRNVLFLVLNSDDPPGKAGNISAEQLAFVKQTLEQNPDVRWTVVAIHKPLWSQANVAKTGWLDVEKALGERKYTVFAGHIHRYLRFTRNGRYYYQLATTGGGSKMRGLSYGEFDHFAWVTMKKDGPVIANLMLDGIYTEEMKKPMTEETGVVVANRKPAQPVRGQVVIDGCPVPGATVVFHLVEADAKKPKRAGDALTEADGSFQLSTYQANDGAPTGDYIVTIDVFNHPFEPSAGRPAKNPVPEKYWKAETTPLKVEVKPGQNEYTFQLVK
jgi:serine/threonine-protein phosphatase CPPED1